MSKLNKLPETFMVDGICITCQDGDVPCRDFAETITFDVYCLMHDVTMQQIEDIVVDLCLSGKINTDTHIDQIIAFVKDELS